MGSLTQVTVDFQTSHLIFPRLIAIILGLLGVAILVTRRREILASGAMWGRTFADMDKPRFVGALVLSIIYFLLMVPVGDLWPNTGLGFLICSIPFVFLTGILFAHERTPRGLVALAIVSVAVPAFVWWLFAEVFFLTLP